MIQAERDRSTLLQATLASVKQVAVCVLQCACCSVCCVVNCVAVIVALASFQQVAV